MNDLTFTQLHQAMLKYYRKSLRDASRLEKRYHDLPSQDLFAEVQERRGFLRGLKKSLAYVESKMSDAELPLEEEE